MVSNWPETPQSEFSAALEAKRVFWVTDPGHGWLAVPFKALRESGVAERISSYSYIGGRGTYEGYALLEEDCDAALYLNAVGYAQDAARTFAGFPAELPAIPEFYFDQPRSSRSVAYNVRRLDSYNADTVASTGNDGRPLFEVIP